MENKLAKEWILNSATNRWQLNYKRNVGATSFEIRKCSPKTVEEWQVYYYKHVRSEKHLEDLGSKLFVKISEVLPREIEDISEEDCISYIKELVINKTFDGYIREINTIYGQLEEILGVDIKPAPDEWDRLFNVDFFIEINNSFIGLQIKPVNDVSHIPQIYKEHKLQLNTHEKFSKQFGGKVFYIYSQKDGYKKVIVNEEVIPEIFEEMARLSKFI